MYDRSPGKKLAQEHLKAFILENQKLLKEDRFFKNHYNPPLHLLPPSWNDFKFKAESIHTLYLLPGSPLADIIITAGEIRGIVEHAKHEIDEIFKDTDIEKLKLSDETKQKLIADYLSIAQKPLVDALQNEDPSKKINLQYILDNLALSPENCQSDEKIAYKILENQLTDELSVYKTMRTSEKESFKFRGLFSPFFDPEKHFSKEDKIAAVTKLEARLKGMPTKDFSAKELRALKNRRLGKIIAKYEKLGLPIENYIINKKAAPLAHKSKV